MIFMKANRRGAGDSLHLTVKWGEEIYKIFL